MHIGSSPSQQDLAITSDRPQMQQIVKDSRPKKTQFMKSDDKKKRPYAQPALTELTRSQAIRLLAQPE
jgi:hypothetical protein